VNPRVKCRKCSKSTCIACYDKATSKPTVVDVQGTKLEWCCSRGRLFMIWILLCGFDQQYSSKKRREASITGSGRVKLGRSGVRYSPQTKGFGITFGKGLSPNNPTLAVKCDRSKKRNGLRMSLTARSLRFSPYCFPRRTKTATSMSTHLMQ
jgi:baculoviral IAP repeat-containing protein 6